MTFDSSPIPGALVPRGRVPFGQHQKECRVCDRERIPELNVLFQEIVHVRDENYQSTSITEVDKSCRCLALSPLTTFSIADPAFTKANKVLEHL